MTVSRFVASDSSAIGFVHSILNNYLFCHSSLSHHSIPLRAFRIGERLAKLHRNRNSENRVIKNKHSSTFEHDIGNSHTCERYCRRYFRIKHTRVLRFRCNNCSFPFSMSTLWTTLVRASPALPAELRVLLGNASNQQIRRASKLQVPVFTPFPVIEKCPAPTCTCRPMPSDLDIDHKTPLNGSMATYAEQVLISTGRTDWTSRIEDDGIVDGQIVDDKGLFQREFKTLFGRGGKFMNVGTIQKSQICAFTDVTSYSHIIISCSQTHLFRQAHRNLHPQVQQLQHTCCHLFFMFLSSL